VTEHLQANDRPNIQTYALCTFTSSLRTFTTFFRINAFINVYYNFFDVYHIYEYLRPLLPYSSLIDQLHLLILMEWTAVDVGK